LHLQHLLILLNMTLVPPAVARAPHTQAAPHVSRLADEGVATERIWSPVCWFCTEDWTLDAGQEAHRPDDAW